jgi:hypothetical protein
VDVTVELVDALADALGSAKVSATAMIERAMKPVP